jgi:hypothetical protein
MLYIQHYQAKISNRLTEYAQKITGDYQHGFRINRGTIENIHILRQIIEKAWVQYTNRYTVYRFKQPLDSF